MSDDLDPYDADRVDMAHERSLIDDVALDRLINADAAHDGPPVLRWLLAATRAPATPAELAGEEVAARAFGEATANEIPAPVATGASARTRRRVPLLAVRLVTISAAFVTTLVAAMAAGQLVPFETPTPSNPVYETTAPPPTSDQHIPSTPTPAATATQVPIPTPTSASASTSVPAMQLTGVAPAKVWVGLRNSDDVGTKFDLLAEVYKDGALVTSGHLDNAAGGSSGFNNAVLDTIIFDPFTPIDFPTGSQLTIKLSVRNACTGPTHNSGTARLWYADADAGTRFGVTIGSTANTYYLRDNFTLATTPGAGPRTTLDVAAGAPCSTYKPFGTWNITQ